MYTWIYFTLLAATMQAVRTAGQKKLSGHINTMATTCVRYLFALPFAWAYLFFIAGYYHLDLPDLSPKFVQYASIGAVMQIIGTAALVVAFKYRNFAVATSLAKTEAIQVAIVGAMLFSTTLSVLGWFSVIVGVVGLIIVSKVKFTLADIISNPGAGFGLASGLALAITTLLIREASLSLNTHLMLSAAFTLVFMITIQTVLTIVYLLLTDRQQLIKMIRFWQLSLFVGVTSVLGSIGWFTAASYQNAAYVKALGQIEFFITLFLTYRLFKEKITVQEYIGMALIILSVVVLLLWA